MTFKYLPWLICGFLNAQQIIPYDWVGQAGITIEQGHIFWNRDWSWGPLVFDGTYTSFPAKFGIDVSDRFQIFQTGTQGKFPQTPDSAFAASSIDYYRGDHLYDQLLLTADFAEKDRLVSLQGFKRNYGGDHGHYLYPGEAPTPIQQSYRFDYTSQSQTTLNSAAIGRFIIHSGLPDSSANGRIDDDILSAGIMGVYKGPVWKIDYHGSIFGQRRKILHSTRLDSSRSFLNRAILSGKIGRGNIFLGLEGQTQTISGNTIFRHLTWSTIYAEYAPGAVRISGGVSILENQKSAAFYRLLYGQGFKNNSINAELSYEHNPSHPYFYVDQDSRQFDAWQRARINYQFETRKFKLLLSAAAGKSDIEYFGDQTVYKSYTVSGEWEFIPRWFINAEYFSQQDTSLYLPSVGSLVNIGLKGSFYLFKQNLKMNTHLWAQGWLDRKQGFTYDLLNEVPVRNNSSLDLPSQWNLNFEASARVKSVVISYRLMNILNIIDSFTNGLSEDQIWLRPSSLYPPLGRFITFGVAWEFQD